MAGMPLHPLRVNCDNVHALPLGGSKVLPAKRFAGKTSHILAITFSQHSSLRHNAFGHAGYGTMKRGGGPLLKRGDTGIGSTSSSYHHDGSEDRSKMHFGRGIHSSTPNPDERPVHSGVGGLHTPPQRSPASSVASYADDADEDNYDSDLERKEWESFARRSVQRGVVVLNRRGLEALISDVPAASRSFMGLASKS